MSIQEEIARISNAKDAIKAAIESKGVAVQEGTRLDEYASLIYSIPQIVNVVPQWMNKVNEAYGVPIENLQDAIENYTFLDYVKGTGKEYINCNYFVIPAVTSFELDVRSIEGGDSATRGLFGSRTTTGYQSPYSINAFQSVSGSTRLDLLANAPSIAYNTNREKLYFDYANRIFRYGSYTASESLFRALGESETTASFCLFTFMNVTSPFATCAYAEIYNFSLWQNGDCMRLMIPCKNVSGEVGMLDLIENVFYKSASSTAFSSIGISEKTLEQKFSEIFAS